MPKADHTFFRNTDCAYFPCHKVGDEKSFNCLFCFCPLYWLPDCGGNPADRDGVKDCTGCTVPHSPGGYEHVLKRLKQEFEQRKAARDESGEPDTD